MDNKYSVDSFYNSNQQPNSNGSNIFVERVRNLAEWFKKQPTYQIKQKKECPPYDPRKNYYQEFWKTYLHNQMTIEQIKTIIQSNNRASQEINQLEALYNSIYEKEVYKKKKKNRRPAIQIEKNYKCPYENCYRTYGSDVSMNLHIKIKHDGGNKTEREKLAKQIIIAQRMNQALPEITIKFPPNFIEQYRQQMASEQLLKPFTMSENK